MLKEFFTKTGITKFLNKVRLSGMTINEHLTTNRRNSIASYLGMFRQMVMGESPVETAIEEVGKLAKRRKRDTLRTVKGVMTAVRGEARAVLTSGNGYWLSRGVLDGNTTDICTRLKGARYDMVFSQIPSKPPRTPPIHNCRSWLQFVQEGQPTPSEESFEQLWRDDDELKLELLGPTRYEAYKRGDLGTIETYPQYEKVTLTTLEDLGL